MWGNADTQEVASSGLYPGCKTLHPIPFGLAHCINRIGSPRSGAHLHRHPRAAVLGQQVDFAIRERDIGLEDLQPVR